MGALRAHRRVEAVGGLRAPLHRASVSIFGQLRPPHCRCSTGAPLLARSRRTAVRARRAGRSGRALCATSWALRARTCGKVAAGPLIALPAHPGGHGARLRVAGAERPTPGRASGLPHRSPPQRAPLPSPPSCSPPTNHPLTSAYSTAPPQFARAHYRRTLPPLLAVMPIASKRALTGEDAPDGRRRRPSGSPGAGSSTTPLTPAGAVGATPGAAAGAGAAGAGRTLTNADLNAIVAAILRSGTRSGRSLTDADVEAVADALNERLEDGALSKARVTANIIDPVADSVTIAFDDSLATYEARQPTPAVLAKMVSDPVIEQVKKATPGPPPPIKYTDMTKTELRAAINLAASPAALRQAERSVIKQRILMLAVNPIEKGDTLTQLVPPTARGDENNVHAWTNGFRITLGVMQVVLTRCHLQGDVPEVFRDWTKVTADDPSPRHAAFVAVARGGRHDVRADGRLAMYNIIMYYLRHVGRNGVYIKMLVPDGDKPEASSSLGHAYYSYESCLAVCDGGKFTGNAGQRIAHKVTRGCLIQKMRKILYEFIQAKDMTLEVLAAAAGTVRLMIMDEDFDWNASSPPDHVGDVTSGPCAWRLLLPREDTQIKANKKLQAATTAEMDMLDAADEEPVNPAIADEGLGWDEDFGIIPMAGM